MGIIGGRTPIEDKSEASHQSLLNTPCLVTTQASTSVGDGKWIALQRSLKTPVLITTGQSQPTSGCRACACSHLATVLATHACASDRQAFAAAMLGVFVGITCYAEPNFCGCIFSYITSPCTSASPVAISLDAAVKSPPTHYSTSTL